MAEGGFCGLELIEKKRLYSRSAVNKKKIKPKGKENS